MEGHTYLRAHDGVCWFYHEQGAFQPYKGIPPESTFARVKVYLGRLEGLFRILPGDTPRRNKALLDAIDQERNKHADDIKFFERCIDAAIFCLGDGKRTRRRGAEAAAAAEEDEEMGEVPTHWTTLTAQATPLICCAYMT